MKKTCIILTALIALMLTACHRRGAALRFETLTLDTLIGDATYECRVEYRFATIANAAKSEVLRTIERRNADYFFELEAFDGTASEAMTESLRQLDEELRLPEAAKPSVGRMQCEVSVESEGAVTDTLLNYTIYRFNYLGGAHGMYTTAYHTYSLTTGYEYSAADLFGEERMEALTVLIRKKLYEKYEATNDDELFACGFFPEYIAVTNNFKITREGVVFLYNPYEIACYAVGDIEVAVSREELDAL